jgi:hypothetical protein
MQLMLSRNVKSLNTFVPCVYLRLTQAWLNFVRKVPRMARSDHCCISILWLYRRLSSACDAHAIHWTA